VVTFYDRFEKLVNIFLRKMTLYPIAIDILEYGSMEEVIIEILKEKGYIIKKGNKNETT